MTEFKEGNSVKIKVACSGNEVGQIITLKIDSEGNLCAGDCSCFEKWELIPRTIENIQEGDLIQSEGCFRRVLGVCGKVVFLSYSWEKGEKEKFNGLFSWSIQDLIEENYSLVTDSPSEEESIEIEGKKYTVSQIKKALAK